jgi:hypothetical protein
MNLPVYIYRPPTSAQPVSILYSLIYGTLRRYYWHNTERSIFEQFPWKFFHHSYNKELFLRAAKQVNASSIPLPQLTSNVLVGGPDGTCFVHLQYHVQDTP